MNSLYSIYSADYIQWILNIPSFLQIISNDPQYSIAHSESDLVIPHSASRFLLPISASVSWRPNNKISPGFMLLLRHLTLPRPKTNSLSRFSYGPWANRVLRFRLTGFDIQAKLELSRYLNLPEAPGSVQLNARQTKTKNMSICSLIWRIERQMSSEWSIVLAARNAKISVDDVCI